MERRGSSSLVDDPIPRGRWLGRAAIDHVKLRVTCSGAGPAIKRMMAKRLAPRWRAVVSGAVKIVEASASRGASLGYNRVRTSQSSGKALWFNASERYSTPLVPPVPARAPIVRSAIRTWAAVSIQNVSEMSTSASATR